MRADEQFHETKRDKEGGGGRDWLRRTVETDEHGAPIEGSEEGGEQYKVYVRHSFAVHDVKTSLGMRCGEERG